MITIALSKGRILKETLPILAKANIIIDKEMLASRRLILDTNQQNIKVIVLRAVDVPLFVKHGAADIGVSGKDVLLEQQLDGIYELLDLKIAKCRLMVAGKSKKDLEKETLKVATKYTRLSYDYFNTQSQQIELIKLYGSIELAPVVGLSDCIVDLVDTGNTLKENGLKPLVHIMDSSSRLIANSAAYVTKNSEIKKLVDQL